MKNKMKYAAVAVASMLLISGCGSSESASQAVDATSAAEYYEAAKAEGKVTVYGPTEDLYAAVYEDFSAEYPGIEIVTSDIFGQELDTRLEGEQIAGGRFDGNRFRAIRGWRGRRAQHCPQADRCGSGRNDVAGTLAGGRPQGLVIPRAVFRELHQQYTSVRVHRLAFWLPAVRIPAE